MFIVAMIILGVLIFLLTGERSPFSKDEYLYTYMEDGAGLAEGAPVRLNGIHVGTVKNVTLSGDRTHQRNVKITLAIERNRMKDIPIDSQAAIAAENVLGTKFINIKQGVNTDFVHNQSEIKALDTAEFEEVVQQSYTLLTSLQGIIKRVDKIVGLVESGQGSIGKLLVDEELYNHVIAIVRDFRKVSAAMASRDGTVGKLIYDDALYNDMRTTMGRLDTLMADLNAGKGTAGKLLKSEELHDQLKATIAKIDLMIDKMNSGQGTVGQLLVNRQLYDNLNGATSEIHELIKDIRANPKKFLRIKLGLF